MKTRHVCSPIDYNNRTTFTNAVRDAIQETKNFYSSVRVVNCGRGVIILPDTNRKQDCTEGEIIKALGLVKKYDGLHLEDEKKENNNRQLVSIQCEYNSPDIVALTEEQVRLLNWLNNREYLDESITFSYLDNIEVEKI